MTPDNYDTLPSPAAQGFAVPGYEIGERLGGGGMGEVYAAREVELGREVAIKLVHPDLAASPDALRRFETEARVTARMPHPSIPPVYAYGRLPDSRPFLVMKLIRGRTLHDLLGKGAVTPDEVPEYLQIFDHVCQAVGFTHDHRVIHRDLKPLNVMVGEFGEVQVMDWGLAKRLPAPGSTPASEPNLTRMHQAMGTPDYMPPEQWDGDWDQVDARADVFALGAILCRVLAGDPPYALGHAPGDRDQTRPARLARGVERLRACGRDPDLVAVAADCLAHNPADRPADGRAVARRVEAFRRRVGERLRNAEVEKAVAVEVARREVEAAKEAEIAAIKGRAKEARRRRRWWVRRGVAAAVVIGLLVGGGYAWWKSERIAGARGAADAAKRFRDEGSRTKAIEAYNAAHDRYDPLLKSAVVWNRPRLKLELARVLTGLGELQNDARNVAAADEALTRAGQLFEELKASTLPHEELALALAELHHVRGIYYSIKSEYGKAKGCYQEGLKLREGVVRSDITATRDYKRDRARSYGYLGDAQLATGDLGEAGKSYGMAYELREELAKADPGDIDAQCLHARDFKNLADLCARHGEKYSALAWLIHASRLGYFKDHIDPLGKPLPTADRMARVVARCDIVELSLDIDERGQWGEAAKLLAAAEAECRKLKDEADVKSGLARVLVCRARLHHLDGGNGERDKAVAEAVELLEELDDDGKAQRDDYYNLAVAYALRGAPAKSEATGANHVLAVQYLDKAIRMGFNNEPRLERDRCLKAVIGEDGIERVAGKIHEAEKRRRKAP